MAGHDSNTDFHRLSTCSVWSKVKSKRLVFKPKYSGNITSSHSSCLITGRSTLAGINLTIDRAWTFSERESCRGCLRIRPIVSRVTVIIWAALRILIIVRSARHGQKTIIWPCVVYCPCGSLGIAIAPSIVSVSIGHQRSCLPIQHLNGELGVIICIMTVRLLTLILLRKGKIDKQYAGVFRRIKPIFYLLRLCALGATMAITSHPDDLLLEVLGISVP